VGIADGDRASLILRTDQRTGTELLRADGDRASLIREDALSPGIPLSIQWGPLARLGRRHRVAYMMSKNAATSGQLTVATPP
jgi:hypothetical protein